MLFLLQDAADGVEAARGENSQGLAGGGGGGRDEGARLFPLAEQQTYMKLTMSRMVEMLFCPAPAECSPSFMYWAPGNQTGFH